MKKQIIAAAAIALGVTASIAPVAEARPAAAEPSIVETAIAVNTDSPFAGSFDILIEAVLCADPAVAATLSQKGQYTVFAPTDAAFNVALGLPADGPDGDICSAFDQETLTDILLYHVANGRRYAGDVLDSSTIKMLNGERTTIDANEVTINGNSIIVTDVEASNGVIHAIDGVLIPG